MPLFPLLFCEDSSVDWTYVIKQPVLHRRSWSWPFSYILTSCVFFFSWQSQHCPKAVKHFLTSRFTRKCCSCNGSCTIYGELYRLRSFFNLSIDTTHFHFFFANEKPREDARTRGCVRGGSIIKPVSLSSKIIRKASSAHHKSSFVLKSRLRDQIWICMVNIRGLVIFRGF